MSPHFHVLKQAEAQDCRVGGENKTWTRGPWTRTLDRVHRPLSWTGSMDPLSWTGSMDSFFNNEK